MRFCSLAHAFALWASMTAAVPAAASDFCLLPKGEAWVAITAFVDKQEALTFARSRMAGFADARVFLRDDSRFVVVAGSAPLGTWYERGDFPQDPTPVDGCDFREEVWRHGKAGQGADREAWRHRPARPAWVIPILPDPIGFYTRPGERLLSAESFEEGMEALLAGDARFFLLPDEEQGRERTLRTYWLIGVGLGIDAACALLSEQERAALQSLVDGVAGHAPLSPSRTVQRLRQRELADRGFRDGARLSRDGCETDHLRKAQEGWRAIRDALGRIIPIGQKKLPPRIREEPV